jgi:ferredoxin
MQIIVDFDMCAATGGCVNQAPEVFEIRNDGFLYVLQESPNESLRAKVKLAEDLCPTGAITIND